MKGQVLICLFLLGIARLGMGQVVITEVASSNENIIEDVFDLESFDFNCEVDVGVFIIAKANDNWLVLPNRITEPFIFKTSPIKTWIRYPSKFSTPLAAPGIFENEYRSR